MTPPTKKNKFPSLKDYLAEGKSANAAYKKNPKFVNSPGVPEVEDSEARGKKKGTSSSAESQGKLELENKRITVKKAMRGEAPKTSKNKKAVRAAIDKSPSKQKKVPLDVAADVYEGKPEPKKTFNYGNEKNASKRDKQEVHEVSTVKAVDAVRGALRKGKAKQAKRFAAYAHGSAKGDKIARRPESDASRRLGTGFRKIEKKEQAHFEGARSLIPLSELSRELALRAAEKRMGQMNRSRDEGDDQSYAARWAPASEYNAEERRAKARKDADSMSVRQAKTFNAYAKGGRKGYRDYKDEQTWKHGVTMPETPRGDGGMHRFDGDTGERLGTQKNPRFRPSARKITGGGVGRDSNLPIGTMRRHSRRGGPMQVEEGSRGLKRLKRVAEGLQRDIRRGEATRLKPSDTGLGHVQANTPRALFHQRHRQLRAMNRFKNPAEKAEAVRIAAAPGHMRNKSATFGNTDTSWVDRSRSGTKHDLGSTWNPSHSRAPKWGGSRQFPATKRLSSGEYPGRRRETDTPISTKQPRKLRGYVVRPHNPGTNNPRDAGAWEHNSYENKKARRRALQHRDRLPLGEGSRGLKRLKRVADAKEKKYWKALEKGGPKDTSRNPNVTVDKREKEMNVATTKEVQKEKEGDARAVKNLSKTKNIKGALNLKGNKHRMDRRRSMHEEMTSTAQSARMRSKTPEGDYVKGGKQPGSKKARRKSDLKATLSKDEPTQKGVWKGGKKAAERERHVQSVAAHVRATGKAPRRRIPQSPEEEK